MDEASELTEFGPREKWMVRTGNIAIVERIKETLQEKIDAGDQVAASNGNAWWQGRLDALCEVRDELEILSAVIKEARDDH